MELFVAEREGACVGDEEVEEEDEGEVEEEEAEDVSLGLHGCDHPREGVLAHEGVDAHSKQDGKTFEVAKVGCGPVFTACRQFDDSNDNHEYECWNVCMREREEIERKLHIQRHFNYNYPLEN